MASDDEDWPAQIHSYVVPPQHLGPDLHGLRQLMDGGRASPPRAPAPAPTRSPVARVAYPAPPFDADVHEFSLASAADAVAFVQTGPQGVSWNHKNSVAHKQTATAPYTSTEIYVCAHAGQPRDRRDPNLDPSKRRRRRASLKCGCTAKISVYVPRDAAAAAKVRWQWRHTHLLHARESVADVVAEIGRLGTAVAAPLPPAPPEPERDTVARLVRWRDTLAAAAARRAELFSRD
ncbi:uncharacterized protein V1510DRAFT_441155 [Dipodascopsis tothii]|uniref:uncharacterized protein n=1 Tax=Dipodascopsis tothii TaxID=44089 RepID=UPI0034CFF103